MVSVIFPWLTAYLELTALKPIREEQVATFCTLYQRNIQRYNAGKTQQYEIYQQVPIQDKALDCLFDTEP